HRHAASLIELNDGRLRAFWFAGSREGGADVAIYSALFDPTRQQWGKDSGWSSEHLVVDVKQAQSALWRSIKKIGNPVVARAADGSLRLFLVTVSLGGWAGSSISVMRSYDEGETWEAPRRLITSPFFNLSTLVKGSPFYYLDGSMGLPVYHEFIGKFAELLRLDTQDRVLDKQRLSHGRRNLQPVVLVQDKRHAQVLMRHGGGGLNRVGISATEDGGQHWTLPRQSTLANPNAALSGLALPGGTLLAVANNVEADREVLSLLASRDSGAHWQTLQVLEDQSAWRAQQAQVKDLAQARSNYALRVQEQALLSDVRLLNPPANKLLEAFTTTSTQHMCSPRDCYFEFSYPYLILDQHGNLQLLYTWNRSFIKHLTFSQAWLAEKLNLNTVRAQLVPLNGALASPPLPSR
ncbi:MAG: sialidase family protein, partial [Pseudomonadota bacterium]